MEHPVFKKTIITQSYFQTSNQRNEWVKIEDVIYFDEKDVTKKAQLREGKYCIIPHTQRRHDIGEFLLRIFAEKSWGLSVTNHEESSETEMMPGTYKLRVCLCLALRFTNRMQNNS